MHRLPLLRTYARWIVTILMPALAERARQATLSATWMTPDPVGGTIRRQL